MLKMFYFILFPEKQVFSISSLICDKTASPIPSILFRLNICNLKNVPYQKCKSMKKLSQPIVNFAQNSKDHVTKFL